MALPGERYRCEPALGMKAVGGRSAVRSPGTDKEVFSRFHGSGPQLVTEL